ncbi:hypothetical protein MD484_g2273, partial [Candolleomyces efflorescens]
MANNLGILVAAWLWNLWSLVRSFSSLTARKPKLPLSSSQPELETGLYSPRTNGKQQRQPPGTLRAHPPKADTIPPSSSNLQNFRFTFEASPSQQSFAQRKEFLPHPSLELKTKPARRSKRSRESVERRRLRRGARVPDFTPPPEIFVEDWSLTHDKKEGDSEETNRPPPIFVFGPSSHQTVTPYPVPSVIITPSTPSEENASRINSGPSFTTSSTNSSSAETTSVAPANLTSETPSSSEILRGLRDESDAPSLIVGSSPETAEAESSSTETADFCQTARVSIHLSDDSSSVSAKDVKSPKEGQFVFSDSLTKIAFGPSQQSPVISPPNLDLVDQPQVAVVAVSDWEAPSFHPILSSTPRLGDRPVEDDNEIPLADVKALLVDRYSRSFGSRNSGSALVEAEDDHGLDFSHTSDGGGYGGASHSVLPYPEIFDFDMYTDFRASMAVFGISSGDDLDELAMAAFKRLSGLTNNRPPGTMAASRATQTLVRESEGQSMDHHIHRHPPLTPDKFSVDRESPSPSGVRPPTLTKFRFSLPIGVEDIQTRDSVEDAFAHSTPMASLLLDNRSTRAILSGGRAKGADDRPIEYSCEDAISAATSTVTATAAKRGEYDISSQFRFPIPASSISRAPPAGKKVLEQPPSLDSSPESSPDVFSSARSSRARARVSSFTESLSNHDKTPSRRVRVGSKNSSLPVSATPPPAANSGSKQDKSYSRKSGYSSVQLDSEIKRYQDHYRHPAYSRSPPIPGGASSNSSSLSSESRYQDSLAGSVGRDSVVPLRLPPVSPSTPVKSLRTYPTTSMIPRRLPSSPSYSATAAALVASSSTTTTRANSGRKKPPPVDVGAHEAGNQDTPDSELAATVGHGDPESPGESGVRRIPTLRRQTTRGPLRVVNSNELVKGANSGGDGSTAERDAGSGAVGGGAGLGRGWSANIKERLQQQKPVAAGAASASSAVRSMMRKVSMKKKINSGLSKSADYIAQDGKVDQGKTVFRQDQDTPVRVARVGTLKRTPTLSRRKAVSPAKTSSGRNMNLLREVNRQEEQRRAGIFPSSDTMNNMTLESVYTSFIR